MGTSLWNFVSKSGLWNYFATASRSRCQQTRRRSSLLTTLTTVDASWLLTTSVNSNPISLRFVLDLLSSLGSNLVSSFSRSVVCSFFFSLCEFQIVIVYDNSFTLSPSCDCGQRQTMNHIVDTCPLTKFECGLNRLNEADDDAVMWLESTATAALAK